jgi:ribokinase
MHAKKIYVIGSANTDMVVKTEFLPGPGETVLGGTFFMNAGGKGANQAVAAARLGAHVVFVSRVGDDIFGKQTIEGLQKENIDTRFVTVDKDVPSGTALITVNAEGENCIVVAPGANARLGPEHLPGLDEADIILMQLEIPVATIEAAAAVAKANKQKVIINPAPAQQLSDELLNGLFLITPNETEADILTGVSVNDRLTAAKAATVLLNKGIQHVIITMGKQGAFYKGPGTELMIGAPVVQVQDTTAAGDTFSGAIAVALSEGKSWEEAIRFAIQAASISVTRLGAQASVPYRSELK